MTFFYSNSPNNISKNGVIHNLEDRKLDISIPPSPKVLRLPYVPTYQVKNELKKVCLRQILDNSSSNWQTSHEILGHCTASDLQRTYNLNILPSLDCEACNFLNPILSSYKIKPDIYPHRIKHHILYADYKTLDRYHILILTCRDWIRAYIQNSKNESKENIILFLLDLRSFFDVSILVADWDTPFKASAYKKDMLKNHHITVLHVPPEHHSLNYAEIKIKNFMSQLRSIYHTSPVDLRDKFFQLILDHTSFLQNRLGGKTSAYFRTFGHLFNINSIHTLFTSVNTIKLTRPNSLVAKGITTKFLGFDSSFVAPTAILLNEETNKVICRANIDCYIWGDFISPIKLKLKGLRIENFEYLFSNKIKQNFCQRPKNTITNVNNLSKLDQAALSDIKSALDMFKLSTKLRNIIFHILLTETKNIFEHNVLEVIHEDDLPPMERLILSKFVVSIKRSGLLKARWVACETDSYRETTLYDYASTINPMLLLILLHLAVSFVFPVIQIDFVSAFLYGSLRHSRYIRAPFPMNKLILRVFGNMYGLKKAAKTWQVLLYTMLKKLGYSQSMIDDCFWYYKQEIFFIVHVDDNLITGTPKATFSYFY